jgi:hypothetical protein
MKPLLANLTLLIAGISIIVFALTCVDPHQEPGLRGFLLFGSSCAVIFGLWNWGDSCKQDDDE